MQKLSSTDWQKLLRSIELLNADIESNTLAQRLTASVNHIVSNEIVSFDIFDTGGGYQGYIVFEPSGAVPPSDVQIFSEFVHEHPLYEHMFVKPKFHAMTFTDYVSQADFEQTALYNEFYRRVGVSHQISVMLPVNDECLVTCALSRCRETFSEGERVMMDLFKTHLTAAIRNSWLFEHLRRQEETWKNALEQGEHGIIVLSPEGNIEFLSRRALQMMERHFADERLSGNCLPLALWNWASLALRRAANLREYSVPVEPLVVAGEDEELRIEFCFDTASRMVTLILKTRRRLTPEKLRPLGVTKTEAKVLYWIAMGKTNPEIAILCGSSLRTVQKHAERIYAKLGVENRTAAALRVSDFVWSIYLFFSGFAFAGHY